MNLLHTVGALFLIKYASIVNANGYNLEISIGRLGEKISPMDYLFQFGYIPFNCPPKTCRMSSDQQSKYIKQFQDFANLEQTGVVDAATMKQMETPRCGLWDNKYPGFIDTRKGRVKRYNPHGTTWKKVLDGQPLTWRYAKPNAKGSEGMTKDLPREDVLRILKKAMSMWSRYTNVDFVEDKLNEPDIWIYFGEGNHGDSFPFDGPGRTLAHAFYPLNNKGLSGDMHFDDAETFTEKTTLGRNFLWVATHELGHSLGLAHSNVREAIMYPWYTGYQGDDFDLKYDDILGIQSLYGGKPLVTDAPTTKKVTTKKTTTTTTTTTRKPIIKNDKCPPKKITALWYIPSEDEYYISTGSKSFSYNDYSGQQEFGHGKFKVSIDAAFSHKLEGEKDDSLIIFSNRNYYVVSKRMDKVSGPYSIYKKAEKKGPFRLTFPYSVKKIEAVMKWQRNNKVYFFYRHNNVGYYRRFDLTTGLFDRDAYGRIRWSTEKRWRLPVEGPDAAVSSEKRGTYFVIGENVYKYDDRRVKIHEGYPKQVGRGDFINCDIMTEDP